MDTVNAIKEKIDIVDLISTYIPLKRAGKNYKGNCPFHNEKTPSFIVSQDIQRYRCFGCAKAGDIFTFVMDYEGIDFAEALKLLADKAGVEIKNEKNPAYEKAKETNAKIFEMNEMAAKVYEHILHKQDVGKAGLKYLEERKANSETIKTFRLGYAPNAWETLSQLLKAKGYTPQDIETAGLGKFRKQGDSTYDMFRGRLMFPLFDHMGKIVGFAGRAMQADQIPKYINTQETPIFHKEKFLYGIHETKKYIKEENAAIIVEGEFDMLSLYQNGYKNVVASKGTALTPGQVNLVKRYTDTAILIFDNDKAGLDAAVRGVKIIQNIGLNIKIGMMDGDVKDPDDLMKKDPKAFKKILKEALPLWDFYFKYASIKFSLNDVFERKKAAAFLYEVLNEIPDSVTQRTYIKKFADLFDTDEAQVESEMKQYKKDQKTFANTVDSNPNQNSSSPNTMLTNSIDPELYVLSLLMHLDKTSLDVYIPEVKEEYFLNEKTLLIFKALKESVEKGSFEIGPFYEALIKESPDVDELFERIYLLDLESVFEDKVLLNKETSLVIRRLKKEWHSRSLKELSKSMKKAESIQDSSEVEKLVKEAEIHRIALNELSE